MKYSDYISMLLPKDKKYYDIAINRMMAPKTGMEGPTVDEINGKNQETISKYNDYKLKNMLKQLFEVMLVNLDIINNEVNGKAKSPAIDPISDIFDSRALTEVDTNV